MEEDEQKKQNEASNSKSSENEETVKSDSPTPNSSENKCSICLGDIKSKGIAEACRHEFCFHCLAEWSKIKPECPLCKTHFRSIIYNVRSMTNYDEFYVVSIPRGPEVHSVEYLWQFVPYRPHRHQFLIDQPRTRPSLATGSNQLDCSDRTIANEIFSHRMSYAPHSVNIPPQSNEPVTSSSRSRIYEEDLWVKPSPSNQARPISPAFFQNNDAEANRLLPWINDELLAIMPNIGIGLINIVEHIMFLIQRIDIRSKMFTYQLTPFLLSNTEHFIHELYNFAISEYDSVDSYYMNANYKTRDALLADYDDSISSHVRNMTENENISQGNRSNKPKRREPHPLLEKHAKKSKYDANCSQNSGNVCGNPFEPGPSTSRDWDFPEYCIENEDECQIVEEREPPRSKTPEVVDLSSDDETAK